MLLNDFFHNYTITLFEAGGIMKKIYIVLTRTNTILSRLISIIKNDEYTHASISLNKDLNYMYSFGRKNKYNPFIGRFVKENIDEGVYGWHKKLKGLVIE